MIELLIIGGILVAIFGFRKIVVTCVNKPKIEETRGFYTATASKFKEECIICFELFNTGVEITQLDCGHIFHTDCINEWNNQSLSCPICRESR